ncbi:2-oxo-4-hydroxy-4-carboxy-5-ureidoimidazoline decarboxylase [Paraliobacillus sediminis]|uniref:2-oxo-4-hydroxy-4-carboxy-5-ureidoimidazoline decarboxylase n=1 Tax=Paraliobacillus sediminis TaxID=1885916 RepID=UPI000E3BB3B6|nr:2-oxo-4-hydroxy-4-carboxy-5-ureidoimidazoline decarboxylase [Paraliobacillus sediminis]
MLRIEEVNQLSKEDFIKMLGGIFENSPWVAKKVEVFRPFASLDQLYESMTEVVGNVPKQEKLELMRAHPNLGNRIKMSDASTKEQQGAGLQDLSEPELATFLKLNNDYMDKFGFPFIIAVKGMDKSLIYQTMEKRFLQSEEEEFEVALTEINKIAYLRLQDKITQPQ